MSTDRRLRWTATSALAVSCFALGFSLWSAGCRSRDTGAATHATRTALHAAPPKAAPPKAKPVVAPADNHDVQADTAPAPAEPAADAPSSVAPSDPSAAGLEVKRLVVTRGVAHREPIDTDHITAGAGPVFAFVELKNSSDSNKVITIDFQRAGGKSVGHIKLKVPAHSTRWRTWGRTRMVDKGGQWTAIVKAGDGTQLAHTDFDVQAAQS